MGPTRVRLERSEPDQHHRAGGQDRGQHAVAPAAAPSFVDAILGLQRLAGNRAVIGALGAPRGSSGTPALLPLQREDADGAAGAGGSAGPGRAADEAGPTIEQYAAIWGTSVMGRLHEVQGLLPTDPTNAYILLGHAFEFVVGAAGVVPREGLNRQRLRLLGRTLQGLMGVLDDRRAGDDWSAKDLTDEIRQWREDAVTLGPMLTTAPGPAKGPGEGASAGAEGQAESGPDGGAPAGPDVPATDARGAGSTLAPRAERWKEGVVLPLGRAIIRLEHDVEAAANELSFAYEVVRLWRAAAPPGNERLRLAVLEREVSYAWQRVKERQHGSAWVDMRQNLATTETEAELIGTALGWQPTAGDGTGAAESGQDPEPVPAS